MRGQARPRNTSQRFSEFLAFAEAVEKRREGADVQSVRAKPQEMAGDSLKLRQNSSNHAPQRGGASTISNFSNCLAVSQAAADGGDVVHTIDIRSKLLIRAVLRRFSPTPRCKYPMMHSEPITRSPSSFNLTAQHAVSGRMLWPHVDDQLIRAQHRLVIVCGIDAQSRFLL